MTVEERFDAAMMDIYRRAREEANYYAARYHQMLMEHGGLGTAQILVNADTVSDGYTALWERGRLDLTVEALIIDHTDFHSLFTDDELDRARSRLHDYGYIPAVA